MTSRAWPGDRTNLGQHLSIRSVGKRTCSDCHGCHGAKLASQGLRCLSNALGARIVKTAATILLHAGDFSSFPQRVIRLPTQGLHRSPVIQAPKFLGIPSSFRRLNVLSTMVRDGNLYQAASGKVLQATWFYASGPPLCIIGSLLNILRFCVVIVDEV